MIDFLQGIWDWNNGLLRYILFSLVLWAGFWCSAFAISRKFAPAIHERLNPEKHPVLSILLTGFKKPFSLFLGISGVCIALLFFAEWRPAQPIGFLLRFLAVFPAFIKRIWRISFIITSTWGLLSSSELSTLILRDARHKLDIKMSKSVAHFLSAIFRVIVVALATVIILSEFGININGLVAGLGLGGLTIALAAKDSAENFFGGLILVMEKPFEIGDWIVCDGVEGAVEDISIRSTKIRTGPGALTIVPNAKLSGSAISNWSGGMEKRRASFFLQLTYSTPRDKIKAYVSSVRSMIQKDPDVISESVIVRFTDFADSSLNIQVIFYTSIPAMGEHLRIKERINFGLLELAEKNKVHFAFPSQSLYFHGSSEGLQNQTVADDI